MDPNDKIGAIVVRVFLVEDYRVFRRALARLLGREPGMEVVAEAGSLAEARALLGAPGAPVGFDVAVLDLRLPDGDGADLVGELRGANPRASVLVLTAVPEHVGSAAAGVDGVLAKDATLAEIVGAVRRFATGPGRGRPPVG